MGVWPVEMGGSWVAQDDYPESPHQAAIAMPTEKAEEEVKPRRGRKPAAAQDN